MKTCLFRDCFMYKVPADTEATACIACGHDFRDLGVGDLGNLSDLFGDLFKR